MIARFGQNINPRLPSRKEHGTAYLGDAVYLDSIRFAFDRSRTPSRGRPMGKFPCTPAPEDWGWERWGRTAVQCDTVKVVTH
jgi:hypothetical protein